MNPDVGIELVTAVGALAAQAPVGGMLSHPNTEHERTIAGGLEGEYPEAHPNVHVDPGLPAVVHVPTVTPEGRPEGLAGHPPHKPVVVQVPVL